MLQTAGTGCQKKQRVLAVEGGEGETVTSDKKKRGMKAAESSLGDVLLKNKKKCTEGCDAAAGENRSGFYFVIYFPPCVCSTPTISSPFFLF